MFFDDRLATVLRQRASSDAALRTQFRQLLDLLGKARKHPDATVDNSLLTAAWLRMDALAEAISSEDRGRLVREPGWRLRNVDLTAHLADFEPEVASAALTKAELAAEEWTDLIPRLPVRARGFLRLRRDLPLDVEAVLDQLGIHDRGLPRPADYARASAKDVDEASPVSSGHGEASEPIPRPQETDPRRSEISALVERIARFRRERGTDPAGDDPSPGLPLDLPFEGRPSERRVTGFGFAADVAGRIEWADPEIAPMVIGAQLVRRRILLDGCPESALERAFSRRQPIARADAELGGADAISGDWIVDARPRFSVDGVFAGYVGRFRRPWDTGPGPSSREREADTIRQLLHELRTPVTAVQGYAEVIQQQLFGPAPHEYRALAAGIAADAARILAGFDELDRLARLESGLRDIAPGESDLASAATRTAQQLAQVLGPRLSGIEFDPPCDRAIIVTLDAEDVDALLWRLLATFGSFCAAGEVLRASLAPVFAHDARRGSDAPVGMARLTCEIPAGLLTEDDIFAAEARATATAINAGLFGAGFALRLARAEARAAGGDLVRRDEEIVLTLPLLGVTSDARDDGEETRDPIEGTGGNLS